MAPPKAIVCGSQDVPTAVQASMEGGGIDSQEAFASDEATFSEPATEAYRSASQQASGALLSDAAPLCAQEAAHADESGLASQSRRTEAQIRAAWKSLPEEPRGATAFAVQNDNDAYAPATLTSEALDYAEKYLNFVRLSAGLGSVTFDSTLNANAAQGALILAKLASGLTHEPGTPAGVTDDQASPGKYACATSNLSYSASTSAIPTHLRRAIQGQMDDSDVTNREAVGHRRWLLNPQASSMGVGGACASVSPWHQVYTDVRVFNDPYSPYFNGSYGTVGQSGPTDYDFIAWPASGSFASNVFSMGTPWSVTLNPSKYQRPSLGDIEVTVRRVSDGASWLMTGSDSVSSGQGKFLNVNTAGYAVGNCIVFDPGRDNVGASIYEGDYQVDISGLRASDGASTTLSYTVSFFDANVVQLEGASVELSDGSDGFAYTGSEIKPSVKVRLGDQELPSNAYRVSYSDNVDVGTATVTVSGTYPYQGAASATFTITKAEAGLAFASSQVSRSLNGGPFTNEVTKRTDGALSFGSSNSKVASVDQDGQVTPLAVGTTTITVSSESTANYEAGSASFVLEVVEGGSASGGDTPSGGGQPADGDDVSSDRSRLLGHYGVDNERVTVDVIASESDLGYTELDDGTVVVFAYWGSSTAVAIPAEIDGRKVTFVDDAFKGNDVVQEVYFPDTVCEVSAFAFEGCTALRCVNLGSLQTVYPVGGGKPWFNDCSGLQRFTMSDSAKFTIRYAGYQDNTVNMMRSDAVDSLQYVYIGASMESVDAHLFYGSSLQRVDVGVGNVQYLSDNGVVYSADGTELVVMGTAFSGDYVVREGCERIGVGFASCSKLANVYVPESVKEISYSAFYGTNAVIVTPQGSYADYYAKTHGLSVLYRGVAVQAYTGASESALDSSGGDSTISGSTPAQSGADGANGDAHVRLSGEDGAVEALGDGASESFGDNRFVISKASKSANPMKVKVQAKTVKAKKLKKKAQVVSAVKVTGAAGKVTFKNVSKKKALKKFKVAAKTGKVTVPKGAKKGTYKVRVLVSAAGDATHLPATKTVTVKIKVK